jgi:CDGSH-type Zn-finger protein
VFDTTRKPWILPDAGLADQVAEAIAHCPSGALHFTRKDGGPPEAPDLVNTISLDVNGPLHVRGEIVVETPDGEVVLRDVRVSLCRCGASKNKPFCDKSHEEVGFQHNGLLGENKARTEKLLPKTGPLKIIPTENGPFQVRGPFGVRGQDGTVYGGNKVTMCRCGRSSNKPFCDDTHLRIGFQSK